MRKILFLDFDGVLHGKGDALFSKLSHFEQCLMKMSEVEVIISSSWRETHPFEQLKELFQISLRERITGMTPSLEGGYQPGGRQREIEAFLDAKGFNDANVAWIALDDVNWFFDEDCPNLLLVSHDSGFGDDEGRALLKWYEQASKR